MIPQPKTSIIQAGNVSNIVYLLKIQRINGPSLFDCSSAIAASLTTLGLGQIKRCRSLWQQCFRGNSVYVKLLLLLGYLEV